jgi:hypothetical protein
MHPVQGAVAIETIHCPSGDQAGLKSEGSDGPPVVSAVGFSPLAPMIQIRNASPTASVVITSNAIRDPSGEIAGWNSMTHGRGSAVIEPVAVSKANRCQPRSESWRKRVSIRRKTGPVRRC